MSARVAIFLSGLLGGIGVAAGAMGAHALEKRLAPELLEIYHTAATYQMYHALALMAVGILVLHRGSHAASIAGWSFCLGTLLFSGSLYGYVLSEKSLSILVAVTPVGGTLMIVGWVAIVVHAYCYMLPSTAQTR